MPSMYLRDAGFRDIDAVIDVHVIVERDWLGRIEFTSRTDPDSISLNPDGLVRLWVDAKGAPAGGVQFGVYHITQQRRERGAPAASKILNWVGLPVGSFNLQREIIGEPPDLVFTENVWVFDDATVGEILLSFVFNAGATFTETLDSAGHLWSPAATIEHIEFPSTYSVLDVLDELVDRGSCSFLPRGIDYVDVFNPGLGVDHTILDVPLEIDTTARAAVQDAPQNRSTFDSAIYCVVSGAPGHIVTANLSADYPDYGFNTGCSLDFPDVDDDALLLEAGETEIRRRMGPAGANGILAEQSISIRLLDDDAFVPGIDYQVRDKIGLRVHSSGGGDIEPWLVDSFVLHAEGSRSNMRANLTLGSRLDAYRARMERRLARLERHAQRLSI